MSPESLDLGRRDFLTTGAAAMAGLIVGFHVPAAGASTLQSPGGAPPPLPDPNAFLRIAPDDTVTILLAHSEMGQGVWTGLAMLVAEELGCDWSKVRVEHAPAAPAYFHTLMPMQMTGGSTTTWSEFDRYRQVGALARGLLVRAAAAEWGVAPAQCRAENGAIVSGDRRATFGALAEKARSLPTPAEIQLKDRSAWARIGKPTKRLDSPEKVTGRALFGQDVRFDGLKVALVERAPVFGAKVVSFEAAAARKVPGVRAVVQVPSGVAVVADQFFAAREGRRALAPTIKWSLGAGGALDTEALRAQYREMAQRPGAKAVAKGDAAAALTKSAQRLVAEYEGPFLAHAAMEPLNCTVRLTANACEIWTGTQFQTGDQAAAAQAAGLKPEQVTLHTMFLGGGFGRRANPASDFVTEAVHVAKASGLPVKVIWTREDDMRGGYYRPHFLHRVEAGLGGDGLPMAWRHTVVCQSLSKGTPFESDIKDGIDGASVEGVVDSPYLAGLDNHLVDLHTPELPVTVLWLRSVGHTHTAFVMESMIDELAHAAKADPVAYRRRLLANHPRHLGALNLAAEKSGWGTPVAAGRARGLAVHASFGSFVATVAEVSVAGAAIRVHRMVTAIDCGICVNPAGVEAQMEGGAVYGLSAALHSELTLKQGRVQQGTFNEYGVLRLSEMPHVEVFIVPSAEKPGGAGEPGVPTAAPAVANAVFALTGKRLRRLPFKLV
jgi:isoquinoline 1-oxidoreductase beta subunit